MPFKKDQEVTIAGTTGFGFGRRGPLKLLTVKAVTPRKLTLSDDTEWRADGRSRWGSKPDRYSFGDHVRARLPTDRDEIRRARARYELECIKWRELSDEEIDRWAALLPARGKEKPDAG